MTPLELLEQVRELQKVDANLSTEEATEIIRAVTSLNANKKSMEGMQKGIASFDQLVQHVAHPARQNVVLCKISNKVNGDLIMVRARNGKDAVDYLQAQLGGTAKHARAICSIYNSQDVAFVRTPDLGGICNIPCTVRENIYCLQLKGVRYLTFAGDIHEAIEQYNESDQVPSFAYTDSDIKELNFSQQIAVL
jgi:hypothetical protein